MSGLVGQLQLVVKCQNFVVNVVDLNTKISFSFLIVKDPIRTSVLLSPDTSSSSRFVFFSMHFLKFLC